MLQRESELLQQHGRQWLGDLGRFLVGAWSGEDKPYHYQFARGWLDLLRVLPAPDAILASLARSPEARLLRRLEVVYDMRYHPFDFEQFLEGPNAALNEDEHGGEVYDGMEVLPPLLGSSYLSNLRVLKVGFSDTGRLEHSSMVEPFGVGTAQQMIDMLEKCPRLEELYLNTNLVDVDALFAYQGLGNIRVLQYYYGTDYRAESPPSSAYPLATLANNPTLQRLTTLRLHPGRDATIDLAELDALVRSPHLPGLTFLQVHMTTFGDEGCRSIVASGILRRLDVLDVGYGNMTDAGARLLAACPDLKHLHMLDVSRNALTAAGIAALEEAAVRVVADEQHAVDDTDYLYEGDLE